MIMGHPLDRAVVALSPQGWNQEKQTQIYKNTDVTF
jgi:hypothetical protein